MQILSAKKLYAAWKSSRDSTADAGRPGIDDVSAVQFAARLESNLNSITRDLRKGTYSPSRLRAVLIPKPNSDKERLICIPTIRDRIVQRAMSEYLSQNTRFPTDNKFSYGFTKNKGTKIAIAKAIELRGKYDWSLKTDIEAFFDRIPRDDIKSRLIKVLPNSSLTPLLYKVVDCEIKETKYLRPRLLKQGIKAGVGLRQGMPLSPLLANFVLSGFDNAVDRAGIEMVRYADDLLLFFRSKSAAVAGLQFIKDELKSQGLDIPEISDHSKTQITAPREPLDFLGRELVYLDSESRYVARVSKRQMDKIRTKLEIEYSFQSLVGEGYNFQEAVVELSRSVASYLGIYRDAYNYQAVDLDLKNTSRRILAEIFKNIFGDVALDNVTQKGRDFLGIGNLRMPEPSGDLDF